MAFKKIIIRGGYYDTADVVLRSSFRFGDIQSSLKVFIVLQRDQLGLFAPTVLSLPTSPSLYSQKMFLYEVQSGMYDTWAKTPRNTNVKLNQKWQKVWPKIDGISHIWTHVRICWWSWWKQTIEFHEQTTSADIYRLKYKAYLSAVIKYTPANYCSYLQSAVFQTDKSCVERFRLTLNMLLSWGANCL